MKPQKFSPPMELDPHWLLLLSFPGKSDNSLSDKEIRTLLRRKPSAIVLGKPGS